MTGFKVLHGQPTAEELAVVLAVVSSRAAAAAAAAAAQRITGGPASAWADRSTSMSRLPRPGHNAWRASAWTR
jgi:hypothetical protein